MHGRSAFFSLENIELSAGQWSQFLSLTFPTIEESVRNIDELRIGVDAIELRVDLLSNTSPQYLQNGIAQLKEASQLPIMFTVRTKCQLGMFPDDKHKEQIELILEGLKAGVDWIDVEATLPDHAQNEICRIVRTQFANRTRIIGSLHTTTVPTEHELELMYRKCDLNGSADILKVVTGAATDDDCEAVHRIGKRQSKPYIGVCLGEAGAYARVLNRRFTPVTHELLKAAAPGQLTARQLLQERLRRGLITPKQFYLFGNPIQHSLSPAIHNGAFETLLMPHVYSLNEQSDVAAYRDVLTRHNFSGASVTIPHKESIIPLLNEVRGAARAIGAVNTIVVETCSPPDGPEKGVAAPVAAQFSTTTPSVASAASSATAVSKRLIGYNTDWIGMRRPLSQLLLRSERVGSSIAEGKPRCANLTGTGTTATAARVGLVIGAGKCNTQLFSF